MKLDLSDVVSGFATTTLINANNVRTEVAMENTLSRDGTSPNHMNSDLDLNGYRILNQANAITVSGFNWTGPWVTSTLYNTGDVVEIGGASYISLQNHTSTVFSIDLSNGIWQLVADRGTTSDTYMARDYGIVGTGLDESSAINSALGTIPVGATLEFHAGTFVCTSPIIINRYINIVGQGNSTIFKFTGCNGIEITKPDSALLQQISIKNLSTVTTDSGVYTGIAYTGVGAVAYTTPPLILENINLSGASVSGVSTEEWKTSLSLTNADNSNLNGISIKGKEGSFSSGFDTNTIGILFNNTTTLKINNFYIYRTKTGINITNQSEGIIFNNGEIVAVYEGVICENLVSPSNNFMFSNMHVAARKTGFRINEDDLGNTIAHIFSNIFLLKRDDLQNGGEDGYRAFDLEVDRCSFSAISTQTNNSTKDHFTAGDRGIYLRGNSQGNIISGYSSFRSGAAIEFTSLAVDNMASSILHVDSSGFASPSIIYGNVRNFVNALADYGVPGTGNYKARASGYDFDTIGGTAFRITNGAGTTDTFIDVFGDTQANAKAVLRTNSTLATSVDLTISTKGGGAVIPFITNTSDLGKSAFTWRTLYLGTSVSIGGTTVVSSRNTGWSTPMTGTSDKSTVRDTATITIEQLAQRFKALEDALRTHGLIGL